MNYVVAFDMSDPAVSAAANVLHQMGYTVVDSHLAGTWPAGTAGMTLYLIDHGNGQQFGDYSNPADLMRENPAVGDLYKLAGTVVLVACSTADEAGLILKNGFQAATFAKNLWALDTSKTLKAAVGPVFATSHGLEVQIPTGVLGFASANGWVTFQK